LSASTSPKLAAMRLDDGESWSNRSWGYIGDIPLTAALSDRAVCYYREACAEVQ
jgi:hypothetical protein